MTRQLLFGLEDQTLRDKREWHAGPWREEPDVEYGVHKGFAYALERSCDGAWAGYVAVPQAHPWHGRSRVELAALVLVHGEVAYARSLAPSRAAAQFEPGFVWWVGFDCSDDYCPRLEAYFRLLGVRSRPFDPSSDVYRGIDFARSEVKRLAEQAVEARFFCAVGQ